MRRERGLILIVDDMPANIHTLSSILKDNYDIKIATCGEKALEIAVQVKPDLIMLDIAMPGMDGRATCKALKADPITQEIPVIFVTAKDSVLDEAIGFALGAVDYIVKPFNATIVRARVKNHMRLKHLTDDLQHAVEEELSKRMEMQQRLNEQEIILHQQSKLAAMGEMIGAIAHQWRQPLNALNMSIQNLEEDFDEGLVDADFLKAFVQKSRKTIQFMSQTIDNFRNFFRVDKEQRTFDLRGSVEEVLGLIHAQLKEHHIEACIVGEGEEVCGLKGEFEQVILNLVANAKDAILAHMPQGGGKITITLEGRTLFVEDNGGGIPEAIIERIFEPYFTTKEEGKGTGIGLYMSKTIIEKHWGGKLSCTPIEGGARFVIAL